MVGGLVKQTKTNNNDGGERGTVPDTGLSRTLLYREQGTGGTIFNSVFDCIVVPRPIDHLSNKKSKL